MKGVSCIVWLMLLAVSLVGQIPALDSLDLTLASETDPVKKLEILNEQTDIAFDINFDMALAYAKKGLALAESTENKAWIPRFSETRGRMHANLGHLDSAEIFFNKAMAGFLAINNQKGEARTLFKIAWLHQRRGEFQQGMEANMRALHLMKALNDEEGIANALGRISGDLYNQEKYAESLEYAKRAMTLCRENNFQNELTYIFYHAGYAAIGLKEYEEALAYFNKALELVQTLELGSATASDMSNGRGNALKKLERYPEAIEAYKLTLENAEKANYYGGVYTATANLGEVLMREEKYAEALSYQLRTIEMQEGSDALMGLTENYGHVSTIYEQLGDYKNALLYQKKARQMRDSTASEASDAAMSELRTKYETEQKEATIALQDAQISQQRAVQWLSFGVLALLALFALSFYRNAQARKKTNALLSAKNAENELLLKEIHHRVKNNLEVVSSLLALQSAQIDDPGIKDAMQEGQNRVNSIGIVHQKLYQGENLGAIEMKNYFVNLGENILDSFGVDDRVTIECAMNQLELDIDTAVPLGLIVNEILTNALKYAFPDGRKGKIRIEMNATDDTSFSLKIADDGVGSSGVIQGTGFGSQLVTLLTQQLSGSMQYEATEGTVIHFDFKRKKVA